MSIIPALEGLRQEDQEVEPVSKNEKTTTIKIRAGDMACRALAYHLQGPGFHLWHCKKKKHI
jgi:hypothetical protein